jgi:Tol biopolymer transport system component
VVCVNGNGAVFAANVDGSGTRNLVRGSSLADSHVTVSPDGRRVAFVRSIDIGSEEVVVMNADGTGQRRIASAGFDLQPEWSPDGSLIAFSGGSGLYVVRPDGTDERRIINDAAVGDHGLSWSPDGTMLAYGGSRGLMTVNVQTGAKNLVAAISRTDLAERPAWSPAGDRIAFLDDGNVEIVSVDGSIRHWTSLQAYGETPSWSPDGRLLAVGVRDLSSGGLGSRRPERVEVFDAQTNSTTALTSPIFGESSGEPQWSPDGRRIAFLRTPTADIDVYANADLWVMNADGSGQTQLSSRFPLWDDAESPRWLTTSGSVTPDASLKTSGCANSRVRNRDGGDDRRWRSRPRDHATGGCGSRSSYACDRVVDGERYTADRDNQRLGYRDSTHGGPSHLGLQQRQIQP